jgi:hypothetical protein
MIGLGSTEVASETRPLSRLTDVYRGDGSLLIAEGLPLCYGHGIREWVNDSGVPFVASSW